MKSAIQRKQKDGERERDTVKNKETERQTNRLTHT
jgi:hypothetical protein